MDEPFSLVKIRVALILIFNSEICLIRRKKANAVSYTVPGGNVDRGESLGAALRREISEELNIDIDLLKNEPRLIAVQDQMVNRPGATVAPRKLHLIFCADIDHKTKNKIALVENDDLDNGDIIWANSRELESSHIYPEITPLLKASPGTFHSFCLALLHPLTDETYRWV